MNGPKLPKIIKLRGARETGSKAGYREPRRDNHNFADVDRALTRWLIRNDPTYKPGCIPTGYIDYNF